MNHHLHPWITRSQRQMQHNLLGHSGVSRWNKFPFSKPLKQSLIMGTEIVPENLETHSALTWLTAHLNTIKHVTMHVMIQQRYFYPTVLIFQILIQCIRQRDSLSNTTAVYFVYFLGACLIKILITFLCYLWQEQVL